jgi:S-DNA-T family DNA segregation ATPase FtsK/SpoIIIE
LQSVKDYGYVEKYTADITELGSIVAYLEKALVERQERTAECDGYSIDEEPLLLLVIENDRLFEYLQTNKDVSTQIVQLLKKYRKYKFAIILSEIDNANVPFNAPEFMKFIKENKRFIFFDDIGNMKFFDVTAKQQKENSKPLKQGDAFVSFNGDIERIKTILYEEE